MGLFGNLFKSEFEKWVENASHSSLCFGGAVIVSKEVVEKYDREMADIVFQMYFEHYRHLDIIDNGMYDCYDVKYVEKAQAEADMINAELDFVPGSNMLLEKLVSGVWDEQFVVVPPGKKITQGMFYDS